MTDEHFEAAVLWAMGTFFIIVLFFIILYLGGVFEAAPYRDEPTIIIHSSEPAAYRDDRIISHSTDGPNMQRATKEAMK